LLLLIAASAAGTIMFADNCASFSICLKGTAVSCAELTKDPIPIANPNIVTCTVFISPSSRHAFASGVVIDPD
jgi:hypothetical protein